MTPAEVALQRLRRGYVVGDDGCWLWQRQLNAGGYGSTYLYGQRMGAHRALYVLLVGPIPDGHDLDHLCRVRHCVNPAHLEPVTRSENLRRGEVGRWKRTATACPQGHPYDEANTYRDPRGWRGCIACRQASTRRAHNRKKEQAA